MAVNPASGNESGRHVRAEGSAHAPERDAVRHVRQLRRYGNPVRSFGADARLADRRLGLHGDPHRAARRRRHRHDLQRDEDGHLQRPFQLAVRQHAHLPDDGHVHERCRDRIDHALQRGLDHPQRDRRHEDRQLDVHGRRRYGGQAALERSLRQQGHAQHRLHHELHVDGRRQEGNVQRGRECLRRLRQPDQQHRLGPRGHLSAGTNSWSSATLTFPSSGTATTSSNSWQAPNNTTWTSNLTASSSGLSSVTVAGSGS